MDIVQRKVSHNKLLSFSSPNSPKPPVTPKHKFKNVQGKYYIHFYI